MLIKEDQMNTKRSEIITTNVFIDFIGCETFIARLRMKSTYTT